MSAEFPILEFDDAREALIEPTRLIKPIEIPERCVLPIYKTVIDKLVGASRLLHVADLRTAMGPWPVYTIREGDAAATVAHPGVGAPLAAGVMEELIALGCRKFIACGSAGVLDRSLVSGTVVVPSGAVRDEGTSYHYVKPAREISMDPRVVETIEGVLRRHGVAYRVGKTWTTDAFYRETPERIAKRKSEGCLTVEMECSALLAVAHFRGVSFGQLLATGDDVSGDTWDPRQGEAAERMSFSDKLFWLAVEACMALPPLV
jgi:uridine phosphorylase